MTAPDDPYGQQPAPDGWAQAPRQQRSRYSEHRRRPYAQGNYPGQSPPAGEAYYQRRPAAPGQGYQLPPPVQGHYRMAPPKGSPEPGRARREPRRKRRIFLWVFLAVQALFILWLVVGLATTHTGPTASELAQGCYHHNWYPLFKSQADCVTHYGGALQDAGNAGKAIGAGIIVVLWVVVDFFMGVGYGVYKLATR